jgi:hypothetical protein
MRIALIVALAMLVPVAPVVANDAAPAAAAAQPTRDEILAQQREIRAEVVAKKGAFKDLSQAERDNLVQVQDRVITLLEANASIDDLNADQRIALFNDIEHVIAAVKNAENNRKICERSRSVGSNRHQVVCMTALEYQRYQERTRNSLRRGQQCNTSAAACTSGGGELPAEGLSRKI